MSILLLGGCAHHNTAVQTHEKSYMETYNSIYNESVIATYQMNLETVGIKFISVGQDYLIVIPGEVIFYPGSPRIRWTSYGILNDLASYLSLYKKVSVRVVAYTPDQLLSHARARNMSNYLWSQDVDARLLSVEGLCSAGIKPVSSIEISFRNELK